MEDIEKWADDKVEQWCLKLDEFYQKGRYLNKRGFIYLLKRALIIGYQHAKEELNNEL